jgi:hypothetical protein
MNATMYCKANYLIFLNNKDEMVGYQLDESTIKLMKFREIKFPLEPPKGAEKQLVVHDIWSEIAYEKEKIDDENAKVLSYKMHEEMSSVMAQVKKDLDKSSVITSTDNECPAWVPISEVHRDKPFQCSYCCHEASCYTGMGM